MKKENKWTTSLDGEIFNGEIFETKEEAIKYMVADLPAEDLKKGFWVGQIKENHTSSFVDCETLIEDARCQAEDTCGEVAEDYLEYITDAQKDELNTLIVNWFDKNGFAPTFFKIINSEKISFPDVASQKPV